MNNRVPTVWLISYFRKGDSTRTHVAFNHNALADFQHIDPDATAIQLNVQGLVDYAHLCRQLDVALNGEDAARIPQLCDIAQQVIDLARNLGRPVLSAAASAAPGIDLTVAEVGVIETLLALAYAVWNAADNGEGNGANLTIERSDFAAVGMALDALEDLPDDQPGYAMAAAAKARWALRRVLPAPLIDASPKGGSDAEPMFYIQDTRSFVGNCPLWWAPEGAGYVTRLDEAGRFTEREAIQQNRTRDTDVPWPCAEIDRLGRITVDVQHMRPRSERLAELQAPSAEARE